MTWRSRPARVSVMFGGLAVVIALSTSPTVTMPAASSATAFGAAAPAEPVTLPTGASRVPDPKRNLAPSPSYYVACWGQGFVAAQQSPTCRSQTLAAINHAHAVEHVRAVTLPRTYWSLPVWQQVFVITNLERVSRGLAPIQGLTRQLNGWAQAGAAHNTDPYASSWTLSSGAGIAEWGSNWAADFNSLAADYDWMYNDGWGGSRANTGNWACTSATAPGCWGHRENILTTFFDGRTAHLAGGTGYLARGYGGFFNSYAELMAWYHGAAPTYTYTWQQAVAAGAR